MRIALYQPEIPPNVGTIMRLCVCMGIPLDIIMPCGFPFDDKKLRRAGMDYIGDVDLTKHDSWEHFTAAPRQGRIILFTTKATDSAHDFEFKPDDTLLFGRETAGVPELVFQQCDARVRLPMMPQARSLNLAISCAMGAALASQNCGLFNTLERDKICQTQA